MIPKLPFEHEIQLESDSVCVLEPNSTKFFVKNASQRLEPYATDIGNNKGSWNYTDYPNFDTGVVGQLRIVPQTGNDCSGCYLKNSDSTNKGKTLLPKNRTIDTTNHTITEDFIIQNDNLNNGGAITIDDCSSVGTSPNNWALAGSYGSGVSITTDGTKITVTGTTDSSGYLLVDRTISVSKNLTNTPFGIIQMICDHTGSAYIGIGSSGSTYPRWADKNFLSLTANVNTTIIVPLKAPLDATVTNTNPNFINGSTTWSDIKYMRMGVHLSSYPNTSITFSIIDVSADIAKPVYLEMQVPDNLMDTSLEVRCSIDGTNFNTTRTCKLDSTFSDVSTTSTNLKFLDSTKVDDVYTTGLGRALFVKGDAGSTANGSTGTITYSAIKGTSKRIGFRFDLPPSDNDRTNFNKINVKFVANYTDSIGNKVLDLSGNKNGTIIGSVTKKDNSIIFDGNTGNLDCGVIPELETAENVTILLWVKNLSYTDGDEICRINGGSGTSFIMMRQTALGVKAQYTKSDSLTNKIIQKSLSSDTSNAHLVIIKWTKGGLLQLKVDNVASTSLDTSDINEFLSGTNKLWLASSNGTAEFGNIEIHDFMIFNRLTTNEEDTVLYQSGCGNCISTTGLLRYYTLKNKNIGSTTFEFTNDKNHFTGIQNIKKPLIGWVKPNGIEYYVFDNPFVTFKVKEDESKVYEVQAGVKKNTRVYHGYISYANKTRDSNSDGVPDVIDAIELMCKRVSQIVDYWTQVSFTPTIATNDFNIQLADCEQSYPVVSGSIVKNGSTQLYPIRTENGLDYYNVAGISSIKVKENDIRTMECKVWDTCGTDVETQWKRVYDVNYIFIGDKVIENGIIRIKVTSDTTYRYIFIYMWNGSSWVGTSRSRILVNIIFSITSISSNQVSFSLSNGYTGYLNRGMKSYYVTKGLIHDGLSVSTSRFIITNDVIWDSLTEIHPISSTNVTIDSNGSYYAVNIVPTRTVIELLASTSGNIVSWVFPGQTSGYSSLNPISNSTPRAIGYLLFDCSKLYTDVANMTGGVTV